MRMLLSARVVAFLALACAACPAASDTDEMDDAAASQPCVPGQAIACDCDDGSMGARTCREDASGYEPCVCEGEDDGGVDPADDGAGSSPADDGAGDDDAPADDGAGDDGAVDDGGDGNGGAVPSWQGDIVPFFEQHCGANNPACHRREAYGAIADKGCLGWAAFEDVPLGAEFYAGMDAGQSTGCPDLGLYERLVGRSPWQCGAFAGDPQETLIIPGDAANSYMVKKMLGTLMCDGSEVMPPPSLTNVVVPEEAQQMFIAWIDAGAPMD